MSRLSDLADRWPVIGPAVIVIAAQVGLIFGADIEGTATLWVAAAGTLISALAGMVKAYKPTTVAKETDKAFELGRAAGVREILEIASREPPEPTSTDRRVPNYGPGGRVFYGGEIGHGDVFPPALLDQLKRQGR